MLRQKSRIIGTKGKARNSIEKMTNTNICVYGKTVCIIGKTETVVLAKQAVESLLTGAPHGNVYKRLEKQLHAL
jgi:ribosomal RNA assembly protein